MLNRMKVKVLQTAHLVLISLCTKASYIGVFPTYLKFAPFSRDDFMLWFANNFFEETGKCTYYSLHLRLQLTP
jgi:hypothetical protein